MAQLQTIGIVSTPGVLGGKPRIEGRRISVQQVAELHERLGQSAGEIAEAYPITINAVYQAVRRGTIPHRRSGTAILIRRVDAERQWGEA
jgi:uncharacterized protein (DUF433 family)